VRGVARIALVALLGLFAAPMAAAGELVSSGPLGLRAPDGLVLGRDTTATVHLHAGADVRLVTNAGTLAEPIADGGELAATLTLPAEKFPQRAIVAAVDREGTVVDWLAIPLAGQASVKVDTEPRASVVVRVGAAEFGPVVADPHGVANVDIVVPPGIAQATTIATARSGALRDKPLPLGVQAFSRTLAVCSPLGDKVTVIATLATGGPATAAPKLTTSHGSLAAPATAGKGVFVATRAGGAAGTTDTTEIRAAFAGEDSVAATCTLEVPATPPSAIRIAAAPGQFVAGHGAVTLTIALDYPTARRRLEVSVIALAADTGTIAAPQRTAAGWTAAWTLPDVFGDRHAARATARIELPGGAALSASFDLALVADTAVRIDISAPAHLRADGAASARVVARVVDRFGNIAPASHLATRARGRVGAFDDSGATYVAPRSRDPGDDVIELSDPASGITGRTTIRLDNLPRRFALSARAGYLSNLGRVSAPVALVAADARLPVLDEHLTAGVEVAGYTTSLAAEAMDGSETVSGHLAVVPVLARVAYRMSVGPVDAWLGGGAGVAFVSSKVSSPSAGMLETSATRVAATGFAGAARRVGPGWIVAEVGYLHATLPADAPIVGRAGGVLATAGFAFELR